MRRGRLVGAVAATMGIVLALAGCALVPGAIGLTHLSAPASASASAPSTGQCWNATQHEAAEWSDWDGSSATPCTDAHVLYTYAVGAITGVSSGSWADSSDPGTPSAAVESKAESACTLTKLLPKLRWNQQLVDGYFFVPSESQWAQGARWVRCDVGVLAYGTTLAGEEFARLPANIGSLVSAISAEPQRYEFCIDSPVPVSEAGPLDNENGQIADCRSDPQWSLAGHGNLPEATGSPFPTGAAANADTAAICSQYAKNDNETWIAYLPEKTSSGTVGSDRDVECWVGQKNDDGAGGGSAGVT